MARKTKASSSKAPRKAKAATFKVRPNPLQKFTLHPTFLALERAVWDESLDKIRWYQLPVEQEYNHSSGGKYVRCRVEVFDSQKNSLGFLPLPLRYRDHWVQLCYTIVHTRCEWDAWVASKPSQRKNSRFSQNLVNDIAKQNAGRLLHYLTIRRRIIEELLSHTMAADGRDHLDVFDEFLIRDARGWLWKDYGEIPANQLPWMKADPASSRNAEYFDWRCQAHLAPELLPPKDDDSWVYGEITHYDFMNSWNKRLREVVAFYHSVDLRNEMGETTVRSDATLYPGTWLEGHAPEVRFLTAEEDLLFNHPRKPILSSPPSTRFPLEATNRPLNCPEARAILEAFADPALRVEIPETIRSIQRLFGERYDRSFWSRVLDTISFNASGQPMLEQGWALVEEAAQRATNAPPSAQSEKNAAGGGDASNLGIGASAQQATHASSSAPHKQFAVSSDVGANASNAGTLARNAIAATHQPTYVPPPARPYQSNASTLFEINTPNSTTAPANPLVAVPQAASTSAAQDGLGLSHDDANRSTPNSMSDDYFQHMQQFLCLDRNMI